MKRAVGLGMTAAIVAVAVAMGWYFWPSPAHFTAGEIESTKSSIRAEFEKDTRVKVKLIHLIKESDRKLVGYVRYEREDLKKYLKEVDPGSQGSLEKACEATMGIDGDTTWSCQ